jgi:hypothetical protein
MAEIELIFVHHGTRVGSIDDIQKTPEFVHQVSIVNGSNIVGTLR